MDANDQEHVTPIFYRNDHQIKIGNLAFHTPSNHHDLSIDTPEQLKFCQDLFKGLSKEHWHHSIDDTLNFYANFITLMSNKVLKTAVIGLGVGAQHALAYQAHPNCELVMVCDFDQEKLNWAKSELPNVQTTTKLKRS